MFDMGERRRRALRFTGAVQGVGFRWNSKAIADSLGCTGWVRVGYCVSLDTIVNSMPAWAALAQEYK